MDVALVPLRCGVRLEMVNLVSLYNVELVKATLVRQDLVCALLDILVRMFRMN